MTDHDPRDGAPDITESVMLRLGYRKASSDAQRRSWRGRAIALRVLQACTMAAALALLATWWMGGLDRRPSQPAVAEALRGSVTRGAGRLDAILLGFPRVPRQSPVQAADADRASPAAGDQPAAVRSY